MKQNTANTFPDLNGNRRAWIGAVIGTIGVNLTLFAIIPNLMHPTTAPQHLDTFIPQINLVRIKRQEEPPPKKSKPIQEVQKPSPPNKPIINQPVNQRLTLPFEINTRLPGGPDTLALPTVTPGVLDSLNLDDLFDIGDLDQPLTVLMRLLPVYPLNAKNRGIEGWVKVRFIVTEQGNVENIAILSAEPQKIFDASVIRCVSGWRFKPGSVGGVPVKTRVETCIRFELD